MLNVMDIAVGSMSEEEIVSLVPFAFIAAAVIIIAVAFILRSRRK
jgi:hypothetical protein